jgi:predicted N-formylglutamate amidohydrolase
MTTAAIREKLHDYINVADDEKVKAIYTLVEGQIVPGHHWASEEEFEADMDERYRRYEKGIDKGYSLDEVKAFMEIRKRDFRKV